MSHNLGSNGVKMVHRNAQQCYPDRSATTSFEGVQASRVAEFASTSATASAFHAIEATPTPSAEHYPNLEKHRESTQIPYWKRVLDFTCICLTAPLWLTVMVLVAFWILLASPGPLLYRQERIGYRGRRFMILKFRTMKCNAETQSHEGYFAQLMQADYPMTKLDLQDVRLIRGGRPIRALGLDELPQLFNVVRGEMSLVGPRPCTAHEFAHYQPAHRERVNAPPGLTGYWQVNGKNRTTFSEMIAMDIYYAKHMSLWLDLSIMLRTLPAIAVQILESRTVRSKRSKIRAIVKERFGQLQRKASREKTHELKNP